jgi:hypothetical protein
MEHADIVDLGLRAVLQASRDAHLELPRQVRVLTVTGKVGGDSLRHGVGVYGLVVAEARNGATEHVAGRVAAGLHGRDANLFQTAPDLRHVLHLDPVHLYVLTRGQIEEVVAEVRIWYGASREVSRYLPYHPGLPWRKDPAGDFDPHHECVAALLLRVYAYPLQPLDLAWDIVHGREVLRVGVYYRLIDLEGMALLL